MLPSTYVRARRQQYDGVDMYYIDTYDEVIHCIKLTKESLLHISSTNELS